MLSIIGIRSTVCFNSIYMKAVFVLMLSIIGIRSKFVLMIWNIDISLRFVLPYLFKECEVCLMI